MKYKFLFSIILILISCTQQKNNPCLNFFIAKESNTLFSCKKIKESCSYKFKFNFWMGRRIGKEFYSLFDISGILRNCDSVLYLTTLPTQKPIVLFDFKMNLSVSKQIKICYKTKGFLGSWTIKDRKYILALDSVFNSEKKEIYKFRFKNINLFEKNDDLVFYVSYLNGIEGAYSSYFKNGKEKIITKKGLVLGEINKVSTTGLY